MSEALFQPDSCEPLAWREATEPVPDALAAFGELECRRFEFSSRGDRVGGRLVLPPGSGRARPPLVLLQHGAGGSIDAAYIAQTAGPWARRGAAVATVDFPLHGARRSTKLSERLLVELAASAGRASDPAGLALWREFARQAVCDLRRALDGLCASEAVDPSRVAYAGFSLGAILGATFVGVDGRPKAAALALGGGGFGPAETDPCRYIGRFGGRPLLLVGAERDERVPRAATEALFAAAREPKRIAWFDCTHTGLPGRGLKAMWEFLQPALALTP
jgi:dienelactone hydrolase